MDFPPNFGAGPPQDSSEMIRVLSPIWERILQREYVGSLENFFDLGGTPWQAIDLFTEIGKVTGRLISPLVIYQTPTIASLSEFIYHPLSSPFPKSVLVKNSASAHPVFLMHGLGGNIMEFFAMLEHLNVPRPVYAIQARGSDGSEPACASIQEMAQFHLEAIAERQTKGSFTLIGYSLGGLVAMETARLLQNAGHDVDPVIMIDSYPPLAYAPFDQRIRAYRRKAKGFLFGDKPRNQSVPRRLPELGRPFTAELLKVEHISRSALRAYRPRYYEREIKFIRAAKPFRFPDDPRKAWSKFVEKMEVLTVPGDHHELLTTHYDQLGAAISQLINEIDLKQEHRQVQR